MNHKKHMALFTAILVALSMINQPPASIGAVSTAVADVREPAIAAKAAIVVDADGGEVLYEKNADARRAPASTTKLMTLLLAAEKGNMDAVVTVPQSAGTVPADSTRVPVYPGEKMPFKDLVYSLMIKSGNDAANAIGTLVAGSVEAFVNQMNARAKAMGLKNTSFKNTHGYPADGHYSSARDLAKIMTSVMDNQKALNVLKRRSYTMAGGRTLTNTYAILDPSSDYYYKYAVGGKTGYSQASGQCFCCIGEKGGRTLVSVVLYSGLTKPQKWIDTAELMEYGFSR